MSNSELNESLALILFNREMNHRHLLNNANVDQETKKLIKAVLDYDNTCLRQITDLLSKKTNN